MKGFKNFVMQGNVIDLAVGVVIGGAFTALIGAFVDNLIQPVINVFGGQNPTGLAFPIIEGNDATLVNIGAVLSAIIAFLITAAVVYFVFVLPISSARKLDRKRRGLPAEEETAVSEDIVLLTEIRDALTAQRGGASQLGGTTPQV
ncbi:MAG: large conductance mechanosensitive channel protein MscL [Dermabacteraceae bacterium]|uniref:large conductance mechanosensitive channel protein MscL n=1 Tax=Brachybacterium sp. TaxID=1891286 RepID=UPI00264C5D31|nr:large conductance mechanosensitive channel protein MscL [Brachybacterium sp.]MDN6302037.1 large conductance mechanosensitive channel protein MscL [Brachybacterium sp.]MDN6328928.1 large conductance mechanosensitive channel protein MscL [Brachybacterium sp.]